MASSSSSSSSPTVATHARRRFAQLRDDEVDARDFQLLVDQQAMVRDLELGQSVDAVDEDDPLLREGADEPQYDAVGDLDQEKVIMFVDLLFRFFQRLVDVLGQDRLRQSFRSTGVDQRRIDRMFTWFQQNKERAKRKLVMLIMSREVDAQSLPVLTTSLHDGPVLVLEAMMFLIFTLFEEDGSSARLHFDHKRYPLQKKAHLDRQDRLSALMLKLAHIDRPILQYAAESLRHALQMYKLSHRELQVGEPTTINARALNKVTALLTELRNTPVETRDAVDPGVAERMLALAKRLKTQYAEQKDKKVDDDGNPERQEDHKEEYLDDDPEDAEWLPGDDGKDDHTLAPVNAVVILHDHVVKVRMALRKALGAEAPHRYVVNLNRELGAHLAALDQYLEHVREALRPVEERRADVHPEATVPTFLTVPRDAETVRRSLDVILSSVLNPDGPMTTFDQKRLTKSIKNVARSLAAVRHNLLSDEAPPGMRAVPLENDTRMMQRMLKYVRRQGAGRAVRRSIERNAPVTVLVPLTVEKGDPSLEETAFTTTWGDDSDDDSNEEEDEKEEARVTAIKRKLKERSDAEDARDRELERHVSGEDEFDMLRRMGYRMHERKRRRIRFDEADDDNADDGDGVVGEESDEDKPDIDEADGDETEVDEAEDDNDDAVVVVRDPGESARAPSPPVPMDD